MVGKKTLFHIAAFLKCVKLMTFEGVFHDPIQYTSLFSGFIFDLQFWIILLCCDPSAAWSSTVKKQFLHDTSLIFSLLQRLKSVSDCEAAGLL